MTSPAELPVRVRPRASANEIGEMRDGVLQVRVTAAPADGKANNAVRRLIAKRLRVGVTRVEIVRGASSRDKVLRVEGVNTEEMSAAFPL